MELETIEASGQNPRISIARSNAARSNGAKSHGRPRVQMDWSKWNRLAISGASDKDIARALGISRRTLKRRKAARLRQNEPGC
jgi:DNA-binding NarL/FixJ family response regulator